MDRDVRAGVVVLASGFVGVILAAIEYLLDSGGVLVDEFITGSVVIEDLMAVTIIICVLFGVVFAVASR